VKKPVSLLLLILAFFAAGAALGRAHREPPPEPVILRIPPEQFPGEAFPGQKMGKWA